MGKKPQQFVENIELDSHPANGTVRQGQSPDADFGPAEVSENPFAGSYDQNDDVDYYPGASHSGQHTALSGMPGKAPSKPSLATRIQAALNSTKFKVIVVVTAGCMMVLVFLTLFASKSGGDGDDSSSVPNKAKPKPVDGSGIYNNNKAPNEYEDASNFVTLGPSIDPNVYYLRNMTLDDQRAGKYRYPYYNSLFINVEQSKDDRDLSYLEEGSYLHQDDGAWLLRKAADPSYEKKLFDSKEATYNDETVHVSLVAISKDLKKALVYSDMENLFRHSSYAKYWVLDIGSMKLKPVYKLDNGEVAKLSYAIASPDFNYISFVYWNNLYVRDLKEESVLSVTQDGSADVFNGLADWVYEEEVLGDSKAVYWSPDETKVAFITFNDTEVPTYDLEFFVRYKYPKTRGIKYPKAGSSNPKVHVSVYDVSQGVTETVSQSDSKLGSDYIVYGMSWINGNDLLIKETDRESRQIELRLYDAENSKASTVRSIDTDDYNGWYYGSGSLGRIFSVPDDDGYIDSIVVNNHSRLAYFADSDVSEPTAILGDSEEDLEAISGVLGYNKQDRAVYFIGTAGSAIQRIVYRCILPDKEVQSNDELEITPFSNTSAIENYDIQFSSDSMYALLSYNGPDFPWQRFIDVGRYLNDTEYRETHEKNANFHHSADLEEAFKNYTVPTKVYETITVSDNVTLEMIELRPQGFDIENKYPLLVSVYGGPGLQKLSSSFGYGFEEIAASSLGAVVIYIDPRGTGGRDWQFQSYARDKIGYWEPRDIKEAISSIVSDRGYIDEKNTAIWGWSYGGFTTLKTLEYDAGETFKYGMSVAPVTNWELYDSIYTERYMGLPDSNDNYGKTAQIADAKSFKKVQRFLMMHGTGDDNVHIQNTLQLLDKFDLAGVENYDMHIFPDSNHNIAFNNANTIVYDKLYDWLRRAFAGEYVD